VRRVIASLACAAAAACGLGDVALEGKRCDASGKCSQGFACDHGSNLCVRITGDRVTLPDGAVMGVDPRGNIDPGIPVTGDGGPTSEGGSATEGGAATADGAPVTPATDFDVENSPSAVRYNGVHVSLAGYAVAVGESGVIVRRDTAGVWSLVTSPVTSELLAVATEGNFVWAVGRGGAVAHSTDGALTFSDASVDAPDVLCVTTLSGQVYAGGASGTFLRGPVGGPVDVVPFPGAPGGPYTLNGVWAESPTSVHFVGRDGTIQTINPNASYTFSFTLPSASYASIHGLVGNPPYATSGGNVFFFGNGYSVTKVTDAPLRSIWVKSASQLYAVGDGGRAFRRLGTSPWSPPLGTGTGQDLHSVHGAGSITLVVGAGGTILKLK
jgi:hypothetical protein